MPCYLISYDLRNKRNYDALYAAIKAYRTWAHIHESLWAVVSKETATEVADSLVEHIDEDDRLFVLKSGNDAAWLNAICRDSWLKKHL